MHVMTAADVDCWSFIRWT